MKIVICFVFTFFSSLALSQNWQGYFSYNEIVSITEGNSSFFAATEVGYVAQDVTLGGFSFTTSINGLKAQSINKIYYAESHQKILIGNKNGLFQIVNSDGSISNRVDIINEVPVAPNKKKINHFFQHNSKVYIATDYGISVFDLDSNEFESTYFIGPSGEEVEVLQTTVFNNELFAVTRLNGIRKALVSNPFIYDFSQWQTFDGGFWTGIVNFNNNLIAQNTNSRTYRYNGSAFQEIFNTIQASKEFKVASNYLVITTSSNVFVLDSNYNLVVAISSILGENYIFSSASIVQNNLVIGTQKNGIFKSPLNNPTNFEDCTPNGPLQNYIFRAKKGPNKLWVVYGNFEKDYNPYPLDELGISNFDTQQGWITFPYEDLLTARSIGDLVIDPNNPNKVYFSSYFSGLLQLDGETFTLFDYSNTGPNGLESLIIPSNPSYRDVRINSPKFDREGNLWLTNNFISRSLKVLRSNNQWQSFDMQPYITTGTFRFGDLEIDRNNTKWLGSSNDGLIGFNDTLGNKVIKIGTDQGLPVTDVRCLAIDENNQLWIGTFSGLRVLPSINRFIQETSLTVNNIVIQEGDLAQELFFEQPIQDIEVDGANRKWVSVLGAGVFLVSPNGQQTIFRFDAANSPLPSNNVNDIEIDNVSGEVFFVTEKGMVSFKATATKGSDNLQNVYVYPNPVRPKYTGTIKITGLMDKCNVKITDIEGNLVHEVTSAGGTIEWDGKAFGKHQVASGVYMVFVATEDGLETTVKKIMVIR